MYLYPALCEIAAVELTCWSNKSSTFACGLRFAKMKWNLFNKRCVTDVLAIYAAASTT